MSYPLPPLPHATFGSGVIRLAAALSPTYGGLCGATCAIAARLAAIEDVLFTLFLGFVIGFLCIPSLAWFFHRRHRVAQSLTVVLLPTLACAAMGGFFHPMLGLLLSVSTYITLTLCVKLHPLPKKLRFPVGHCQSCGYNLAGLKTQRCPECGKQSSTTTSNDTPS